MVYDPSIGNVAWPGGPPLGAIAAINEQARQQAAREAAEQAKATMRASGATCEIELDGARSLCGVPAAGRCGRCNRAFCETHQSVDRSEPVGNLTVHRPASPTECQACHERAFTQQVTLR